MEAPSSWYIPQDFEDLISVIRSGFNWNGLRSDIKRQALENQKGEMLHMIGNRIWNIEDHCRTCVEFKIPEWEPNASLHIRILWAQIYTAARFSSTEFRDRLVIELMLLHGAGRMTCVADYQTVEVSVANRVLWADLPFFAEDMIYFYNLEIASMSRYQRRSLHYVLATVAGGNIISEKLCAVGILVLREAFETPRDMGSNDTEDVEDETRTAQDLTVLDLLDCAGLWLMKARDQILKLSTRNFSDYPREIGRLGPLAQEAGVPDNGGFSEGRWKFWKDRYSSVVKSMQPEMKGIPQGRWPDSWLVEVNSPTGDGD